jgi:hypothetical protein
VGTRRSALRLGVVCATGALIAVASCRDATEVTLVLTTNVPCKMLNGTTITVGSASEVDSKSPLTDTHQCDANGNIGTLVLFPSSSSDASFAVRIVSGVGIQEAGGCSGPDYKGCIVARRELSFVPHTSLTLPIEITLECLNNPCDSASSDLLSCYAGQGCGSAKVSCATSGTCQSMPTALPDASTPGVDAAEASAEADLVDNSVDTTIADSSLVEVTPPQPDGGADVEPPVDAPPDVGTLSEVGSDVGVDAKVDAPVDAPPDVTIGVDAPVDVGVDAPPDVTTILDAAAESGPPVDGGPPYNAAPGPCVANGTNGGVACSTGRCAAGQVCCVTWDPSGLTAATESCTSSSGCNTGLPPQTPTYSSLGCRDNGDCATGVCCLVPNSANSGMTSTCTATCPGGTLKRQTCVCSGECSAGTCTEKVCAGFYMSLCGGGCP